MAGEKPIYQLEEIRPKALYSFITLHIRRICKYWHFMAWSQWLAAVRTEYQKVNEYQKSLVKYKKKVKEKYVPENSIYFKSTLYQRTSSRIPMGEKNGNLFLDLIKKHKLSGKTVVFKSPCLVLQGSNTNTGAAGPITKARMKRKSKTAVNWLFPTILGG